MSYNPMNEKDQQQQQQQLTQPGPPGYQQVAGPSQPMQAVQYPAMVAAPQPPQYVQQPFVQIHGYPGMGMVQVPPPRTLLPKEMQPNDYLVIALVITIVCGFLNLTSMFFSVPAIICSILAYEKRNCGYYDAAKRLGFSALVLSLLAIAWVMVWGVITTGLVVACTYKVNGFCGYSYYRYSYYYSYYYK